MTKTVLMCVVQWVDADDEPRLEACGWSDCPKQRDQIRETTLKSLSIDPKLITAVRFMEVEVPLVEVNLQPTVARVLP